jgi:5-methylcytosine-specific restriction endonuclease McrA
VSRVEFDWIGREPNSRDLSIYRKALRRDLCPYCQRPATRNGFIGELDHVVPKSRGGDNSSENLVGICGFDNRAKSTASLLGYLGSKLSLQVAPSFEESQGWMKV